MNTREWLKRFYIYLVWKSICEAWSKASAVLPVPDHDGGRPKQINAWFLYTHMVYL
jgi:hypothetical protein